VTIYLDTNCIIYFVENHPVWCPKVTARMVAIRAAGDGIAVGDLARSECLVIPFRNKDAGLESRYRAFFGDADIQGLSISVDACERAARLRADYSLKLPDALHLETAIEHGCGLFLTADAQLARCPEIAVEVLV
jgi:uncharacterized protein